MSIDNITAKIVGDATEYADGLISEAVRKAEAITAQASEEALAIKRQMAEKGAIDAVTTKHRRNSIADLEARKIRLAAKQKTVSNAIEAALNHLANMDPDDYIAFLVKKIAATDVKEGQLLLNTKDKAAIGERLVAAANEHIEGGRISLSDQTINAKGGFVLKYGAVEINSTLETMLCSIKESVTPKVVSILYQE